MKNGPIRVIDLVPGKHVSFPEVDVSSISSDIFWRNHVLKHVPIIIRNAVSDWRAVCEWRNIDYLAAQAGSMEVMRSKTFNFLPIMPNCRASEKINFLDVAAEIKNAEENQTISVPSTWLSRHWQADTGTYSFLDSRKAKSPRIYQQRRLFIYKNASTEWHFHTTDETLTTQLVGSKRISAFRLTKENWNKYSEPIRKNLHHFENSFDHFPEDQELLKYDGILRPGDALYLPPFWWHGVDPVDSRFGVTLAHCFRTPLGKLASFRDPAVRAVIIDEASKGRIFNVAYILILGVISTLFRLFSHNRRKQNF